MISQGLINDIIKMNLPHSFILLAAFVSRPFSVWDILVTFTIGVYIHYEMNSLLLLLTIISFKAGHCYSSSWVKVIWLALKTFLLVISAAVINGTNQWCRVSLFGKILRANSRLVQVTGTHWHKTVLQKSRFKSRYLMSKAEFPVVRD